MSLAAGMVERGRARNAGRGVEAEALRGRHEPLGAELGTEGREDGVAGLREGVGQRSAARLAVGVLDLDALQGRGRLDGVGVRRLGDARGQRSGQREDLERRARGLEAREGDAGEAQQLARARVERHDPAQAPGQAGDRRPLDARRDRRADGGSLARGRHRQELGAREQTAPRPADEGDVERALEPGHADGLPGGHAEGRELGLALGRGGPELAHGVGGHVGERRRRRAGRALGEDLPVAGEQRAARGHRDLTRQLGARRDARERQGAPPVHLGVGAAARHGQDERLADGPEDPRLDGDRDGHAAALRLLRAGCGQAASGRGRGDQGRPVQLGEARAPDTSARVRGQLAVHRGVVPALPGAHVAVGDHPLVGTARGPHERADRERGRGQDRHAGEPTAQEGGSSRRGQAAERTRRSRRIR